MQKSLTLKKPRIFWTLSRIFLKVKRASCLLADGSRLPLMKIFNNWLIRVEKESTVYEFSFYSLQHFKKFVKWSSYLEVQDLPLHLLLSFHTNCLSFPLHLFDLSFQLCLCHPLVQSDRCCLHWNINKHVSKLISWDQGLTSPLSKGFPSFLQDMSGVMGYSSLAWMTAAATTIKRIKERQVAWFTSYLPVQMFTPFAP